MVWVCFFYVLTVAVAYPFISDFWDQAEIAVHMLN